MSTIDEAKKHLMMTISFITSRSNDGMGMGSVSDSRGGTQSRHDNGKGEEGVIVDKADKDSDKGEKGLGIARTNSDSLKESPADKVADVVGYGKDAGKSGRDAVRNDGFVLNKLITDISIPKSGHEDTDPVGGAASERDSTKGKYDPIAAIGVYHLRERRSAGGTIRKGNTIDRRNVAGMSKFGKKSNKKNVEILVENIHENLPAGKKSALAAGTISIDAKKSSGPFDCSDDEEQSKVSVTKLQDGAAMNGGGSQKAVSKKVNSTSFATQVSPDILELKNDFSACVGSATNEEIKCLGGNTQTIEAKNEDFSVMDHDWDELSNASMSDWHTSSLDEKFGAVDTSQSISSKASADRLTRDKAAVQTDSEASLRTRSQEKVPASSSQSRADDDVAKQGIQDIFISGSNDFVPIQKDETERRLSTLSEGWTLSKIPTNGRANQEIHYKSPTPKLEFKSYHIAREFDRMQVKHPEGEESAESEEEGPHQKGTSAKHSPSPEQVGSPEESRLLATETDALLDSSAATDKSRLHGQQTWLCSRGWKIKKCSNRAHSASNTQWLSPEFKIEFYFKNDAEEFDEICQKYNGNEELAWGHYVHKLTKQSRKIGAHVVGGHRAFDVAKSRTLTPPEGMDRDKPLTAENDDECYICEEGGDLSCCDYCEKSFHLDCHMPRLFRHQISSGNWKSCECKAHEMPLTRCGECEDCTSVPRQKCNNKRFAESEVLLRGGKRKEPEYLSNSVEVVHRNKKRKRAVAPVVVDDRRIHGVASGDDYHIISKKDSECNLNIKQRKAALISRGWSSKPGYKHHEQWLSPKRKLEVVTIKAAEKFDDACQECLGDQYNASILYTKRMQQQGHSIWCDAGGGASASTTEIRASGETTVENTSDGGELAGDILEQNGQLPKKSISNESRDSEDLLFSKGWTKVVASGQRSKRHLWVSPKLKIHFKYRIAAILFDNICQENNMDEVFSFSSYTKKIKQSGRKVSRFILGGECIMERKVQEQSKRQKSQANSFLPMLSCGWSRVHHKRCKGVEVHFKSPQYDVEFRSFKAAKLFDDVLRRNPNETEALDDFIRENGIEKFRNMVYNFGTYTLQKPHHVKFNRSTKAAQEKCQSMTDALSEKSSVISKSKGHIVDEDYWEVEKVVAQRYCNRRMEYLIRWKGCSSKDDTWEPDENLCDSAIHQAAMLPNLIINDPKFREALQKVLSDAIVLMKEIDREKVFHYPVTDEEAPEYSTIIVEPMCLSIMEEKVMDSLYRTIEEFTSDSMLMFSNCIKFNNSGPEGLWYRKEAERQRRLFRKEVYQIATEELENQLKFASRLPKNHMGSLKRKRTTKLKSVNCQMARSSGNSHKSSLHSAVAVSLNNPFARRPTVERLKCSWTSLMPTNKIGSKTIYSIRTGQMKLSFFSHYFVRSLRMLQVPFDDKTGEVDKKIIEGDGKIFELVSCKVPKKAAGSFRFSKQPDIEFLYVNTGENGMLMMNLQKELELMCSFGSLDKRKAIARLGHLQSEAVAVMDINYLDIEIIPERGHEGCGFMPPNFFLGIKNCTFKKSDALQVRIISPKLGLIKGMLLVKSGIERIQIPESMIKVGPSKTSSNNWATAIIKKLYAPSAHNKLLGRLLDPNQDPPNSFKVEYQKSLSEMYQRILIGFGVPKCICDDYVRRSRNVDSLMHTHLMGVADPTGCIPYGEVFIPGYATNVEANNVREIFGCCLKYGKVFISRSPCLEATDAKILSVLKHKPKQMSASDWENLCAYNFGTVIFGLPRSYDDVPIPSLIADGDLDGDLYFVLWDEEILGNLLHPKDCNSKKALRVLTKLEATDKSSCHVNKASNLDKPYQKKWFVTAQNEMTDVNKIILSTKLVGSLYRLCQTYSKKENGFFDIYDEDAIAFAQAYKNSMDVQKHGGKVYLPAHLHEALAPALRDFLTTN